MDVDFIMKLISFILMASLTTVVQSESLDIYGSDITMKSNCTLMAGDISITLALENAANCSFINHSRTNIPHLVRIKNNYIVLIESTKNKDGKCISNYTAISVKPNGEVIASEKSKRSGSCNIGREEKVFKYFAHKIESMKSKGITKQ